MPAFVVSMRDTLRSLCDAFFVHFATYELDAVYEICFVLVCEAML